MDETTAESSQTQEHRGPSRTDRLLMNVDSAVRHGAYKGDWLSVDGAKEALKRVRATIAKIAGK